MTLKEPVDSELLNSLKEGAPQPLSGVPTRAAQVNDAIPRVAPKWLKHDRQVSAEEVLLFLNARGDSQQVAKMQRLARMAT